MTKMLKFNGRQTSAGGHKISVRETDLHLPTEGIFRLIEAKLLLREKSEAFQNGKESGGSSQNRSSRGEVKGKKGFSANSSPSPVHAVGAGARGTSDSGSLGGVSPAGGGPKAPPSPRTSGASPTTATKPPVEPTRAAGRATEPETAWPEEAQPESWGKGGGAKGKGPSSYYPPSQPWWTSKGSGAKGKGKGAPPYSGWQSQNPSYQEGKGYSYANAQWGGQNSYENRQPPNQNYPPNPENAKGAPKGKGKSGGKGKGKCEGKGWGGRGK